MNTLTIVIDSDLSEKQITILKTLAELTNFPVSASSPDDGSDFISYKDSVLTLEYKKTETGKFHTLSVNFNEGKNSYRLAKNCTIKQPIAKAVGIKPGFRPDIIDVTAGLGQDGFVFASLGSSVTLIERSPLLHALLSDGLYRASKHRSTQNIVNSNIKLLFGNSIDMLASERLSAHTVYLDPMYPGNDKSALNKIEMRIIRDLVGDDNDSSQLLNLACSKASNRVVVKRPKRAESIIGDVKPDFAVEMKNSRFDIYLTKK